MQPAKVIENNKNQQAFHTIIKRAGKPPKSRITLVNKLEKPIRLDMSLEKLTLNNSGLNQSMQYLSSHKKRK